MIDENYKLMQDVREGLIRMEGKLDNMAEKHINIEKRVTKVEDNISWLVRTVVGQLVISIVAFVLIKR